MKKKYELHQQFFVTYAMNERTTNYEPFRLKTIQNTTFGLYDIIVNAQNNELSDGEVANALLESLERCLGDNYEYKLISLINWYPI